MAYGERHDPRAAQSRPRARARVLSQQDRRAAVQAALLAATATAALGLLIVAQAVF